MINKLNLIIIISLFLVFSCKSQQKEDYSNLNKSTFYSIQNDSIKKIYQLSDSLFNSLAKNQKIIKELSVLIKDSSKVTRVKRRLNMYFIGTYNTKKLLVALELERILKDGNFEFDDSIDPNKVPNINSIEELNSFMKTMDKTFEKNVRFKKTNDSIKKDSIKNKKKQ